MKDFNNLILFGKSYGKQELLEKSRKSSNREDWEEDFWPFIQAWLNEEDTVDVQTSGSTGTPKIIKLSKDKMLASASSTCQYFKLKVGDKALLCMSPKHIGGIMIIVRAFYAQLDLHVVLPSSNPLENETIDYDFIAVVPYQASITLVHHPKKLSRIKHVLLGGGKVDRSLEQQLTQANVQAYSSFGMTETISHFAIRKIGNSEAYTCLPGYHIDLSADGTLIVHAPALQDQAIQTKDIIEYLSPSSFNWLGRSDFAIESGGVKILPEQVEQALSINISERFFITSQAHPKLNNEVVLVIEGKEREIEDKLFDRLPKYHRPRKIVFLPKFVETASGKINRLATASLLKN